MKYRASSPTSSAAIGNVDRQYRVMEKETAHIAARKARGLLTPEEETAARQRFTGVFRRLLDKAMDAAGAPPLRGVPLCTNY